MGQQDIPERTGREDLRVFARSLLEDLRALEQMLESGAIESGVRRIGAEQEVFLVDSGLDPAPVGQEVLARLANWPCTSELGLFNLELNLAPLAFDSDCLSRMERELDAGVAAIRAAALESQARVVLAGILPTLEKRHLGIEWMTPLPRYAELNRVMTELSGGEFSTFIKGLDELQTTHTNVMLEACNTSFQVHFQVGPEEFASLYNLAQLVTAPVLAAAVNSPVLLRHRLWHETRVALFQQSLDVRSRAHAARGQPTRVSFGERWVERSVLEIYREDVARYRIILGGEPDESPLEVLARGEVPRLGSLRLFNGTIYRWNRPCYGVHEGRAHLRIENRVLPAGPTTLDEVANAALFFGLMSALGDEYGEVSKRMPFDAAKQNFLAAARYGLDANLRWIDGETHSVRALLRDHLVPLARQGLVARGIDSRDVERYMGVIEGRVESGRTGARWALDSLAGLSGASLHARQRTLVREMLKLQQTGDPVHQWPLASAAAEDWREDFRSVRQLMTTDLFTVGPEDLVDLAANLMDWEHLRHVPVEDQSGQLVGIVSHRAILRAFARSGGQNQIRPVAVHEIMRKEPVSIAPDASPLEAMALMRRERVACLPVVEDGHLVGILTEHDFMHVARWLLERALAPDGGEGASVADGPFAAERADAAGAPAPFTSA